MKKGIGHIVLTDGKMHFLVLKDGEKEPLVLSKAVLSAEEALQAALDFAMDNGSVFERAVIAVDGRNCFLKNFKLPIKGKRQLENVVGFEMEEAFPVDLERTQTDFFKGDFSEGFSHVMAAAVQKEPLVELIKASEELNIRVDRIDVDVSAFAKACVSRFSEKGHSVGLDIGQDRILFCSLTDGKIQSLFIIPWGDSALVDHFIEESGLPREEVDRVMMFGPRQGEAETDEAKLFNKCLNLFLRKVMREVARLIGEKSWPASFILSGEIVRAQELRALFERISESRLYIWEEHCLELGGEIDEGLRPSGIAVVYGVAESTGEGFNFRKGEFASANDLDGWRRDLLYMGSLALVLALSVGVYGYAKLVSGDRELEYLQAATLQVYKEALPNVSQDLGLVQYESILLSKVQMLTGDTKKNNDSDERSVIETLRVVSSVLDSKTDVEFQNLSLDGKRLDLQGVTSSMNEVDRVRAALVKAGIFKGVTVKNATADKRSKKIRFEIEVLR